MEQQIGYLHDRRGRRVAYATLGRGKPLLVCETGFVSHLEVLWSHPTLRRCLETLAQHRRVIRVDLPGTGLSAGEAPVEGFEERVDVYEDVLDRLGLDTIDAIATCQAGPALIACSARRPGRVRRLLLWASFANGRAIADPALADTIPELIRVSWGFAAGALADVYLPHATGGERRFWARLMSSAASSEEGARLLSESLETDVRGLLGKVDAETLVIHPRRDRVIRLPLGEELAAGIPKARLVVMEGSNHLLFAADVDPFLRVALDFLDGRKPARRRSRLLSDREKEVAGLVRDGLTNGEIAARLGITLRTAESHVEHIRDKLGFRSRSQVAVWAAANLVQPAEATAVSR